MLCSPKLTNHMLLNTNCSNGILDVKNIVFKVTKSILKLRPVKIQIKTKTNESFLTIKISYFDEISLIKNKIQMECGIPCSDQILFYKNKHLKDEDKVSLVEGDENPTFLLLLKNKYIKIIINVHFASALILDVPIDMSVNDVMIKIKHKLGINENKQELIYNNLKLENQKTLSDYEISNGSTLCLLVKEIDIKISIKTMISKFFDLEVKTYETIGEIKDKINSIENISTEKQILLFEFEELDNVKTIEEYKIHNMSVLYLVERSV
ncbi:hypothetical protein SteCoe_38538 [Stentor coeruleus]|uniref:Ubiquitin-like domain-containing protein n=1 Tax=Stentor coeruleus TaxID=5963 RepID=A0A1R2ALL3_9CILI|nr:hypothetical protein SteCoe_38538 [Stentor coeruleus]